MIYVLRVYSIFSFADNESKPEEAVKWFYRAAESGYARAQYNLGLCLHKGRGTVCSLPDAVWFPFILCLVILIMKSDQI